MNQTLQNELKVPAVKTELNWVFTPADDPRLPTAPVHTNLQTLPLHEIGWQNFERLSVRLGQRQPDAGHCQAYGVPGQEQQGIDLYIRKQSNARYIVWQCKCYETMTAAQIREAVDEFLRGEWPAQSDV